MKRNLVSGAVVFILAALLLAACSPPGPSTPEAAPSTNPFPAKLVVTTPAVGGAQQIYGATVSSIVEKYTKVVMSPQPCSGSAETVQLMLRNESQMAATTTQSMVAGYFGMDPFPKSPNIMRGFSGAYRSYAHFIVRADSGIKSFADLKGKRCMFSRPGEVYFQDVYPAILEGYGLKLTDVTIMPALAYAEQVAALKQNQADAIMAYSALPSPQFLELDRSTPLFQLPISSAVRDEVIKKCAYLVAGTMKGAVYSGTPNDTLCVIMPAGLCIRADVNDDFAYQAIKNVCVNMADLNNAHSQFKTWTTKDLASDPVVPYHAGVYKYYKEAGLLTPEWDKKHQELLAAGGQIK